MNEFNQLCATYGIRATTVRRQLYTLLQQKSPLLAAEFIDIAQQQGFDTVSIYRTINLFQKIGVIYEFGSGKQRTLQIQAKTNDDHHHYIKVISFVSRTFIRLLMGSCNMVEDLMKHLVKENF